MSGVLAPTGPSNDLSLPSTIPTAWAKGPIPEEAPYLHLGAMSLQRLHMGNLPIVYRDDSPVTTPGVVPIPSLLSAVQTTSDLPFNENWGIRGTVGYLCDDAALEVSGFYLPSMTSSATTVDQGRLILLFQNAPAGFQGNHGLWLQADEEVTSLRSTLGSAELNYRWWNRALTDIEGILGVRYLDLQEKLSIFTDESGLSMVDPTNQANYLAASYNRIVAPQFGFEGFLPLGKWANLSFMGKGAWGVNLVNETIRLKRGDGLVGLDQAHSDTAFGQVYEAGAFLDIFILDRLRLRGGYQALWVVGVNEPTSNINYDLSQPPGNPKADHSIFYHGPMVELQFLF